MKRYRFVSFGIRWANNTSESLRAPNHFHNNSSWKQRQHHIFPRLFYLLLRRMKNDVNMLEEIVLSRRRRCLGIIFEELRWSM